MTEMQEPTPDTLPASAEVAAVRADPNGPAQAPVAADAPETPAPMPRPAPRDPLDREEREIKDNVLRLGSMVSDQVLRAIDALEKHDAMLATQVIASDGRLNEAQRLITALVARTIATQQPVARDLRDILAAIKIASDIERIGD